MEKRGQSPFNEEDKKRTIRLSKVNGEIEFKNVFFHMTIKKMSSEISALK